MFCFVRRSQRPIATPPCPPIDVVHLALDNSREVAFHNLPQVTQRTLNMRERPGGK